MPVGTDAFLVTLPAPPPEPPPNPAGPGPNTTERLLSRMHRVLRESPAPNLRELLGAVARGFTSFGPGRAIKQLYLGTARTQHLDAWGDAFSLPRKGTEANDDPAYRSRLALTALKRDRAAKPSLEAALNAALGLMAPGGVTLVSGDELGARWDEDSAYFTAGTSMDPVWTDPLAGKLGWTAVRTRAGAFGPAGLVAYVPLAYTEARRDLAVNALAASVAMGTLADLVWSDYPAGHPGDRLNPIAWVPGLASPRRDGGLALADGALYGSVPPLLVRVPDPPATLPVTPGWNTGFWGVQGWDAGTI